MSEQPMADTQQESNEPSLRKLISLKGLTCAAASMVCVLTLTGFLGGLFWMFEVTSHFRLQYAVLLLLFTTLCTWLKAWRFAALFFIFAMINGSLLIKFISANQSLTPNAEQPITMLAWNVNSQNREFNELTRLIAEHDPDLILIVEVSSRWGVFLNNIPGYSNNLVYPRDDNFGIALLSRTNSMESKVLYFGDAGVPSIHSRIQLVDKRFSVLGTHPLPPSGSRMSELRDQQLVAISNWATAQTNAVIVVGDLNITPWSPIFSKLTKQSGLINSAEGRGTQGTWPAFFKPMLIPIDHFLHSKHVIVKRRSVLDAFGSDHFPLLIEFTIR